MHSSTRPGAHIGVADVAGVGLAALPQERPRLLERLGPPAGDEHPVAVAVQRDRGRPADAGTAARDDRRALHGLNLPDPGRGTVSPIIRARMAADAPLDVAPGGAGGRSESGLSPARRPSPGRRVHRRRRLHRPLDGAAIKRLEPGCDVVDRRGRYLRRRRQRPQRRLLHIVVGETPDAGRPARRGRGPAPGPRIRRRDRPRSRTSAGRTRSMRTCAEAAGSGSRPRPRSSTPGSRRWRRASSAASTRSCA